VYQLEGIIKYYQTWVLAWLPDELDKYYRALLPKAWYVRSPMNKPHVSIVRKFETPDRKNWGMYDGDTILVTVYPGIRTDGTYFWLDCDSDEVGYIRRLLGLTTFRNTNPEYPIYDCYHITIGNVKNEQGTQRLSN
jgi:hypothetical protein